MPRIIYFVTIVLVSQLLIICALHVQQLYDVSRLAFEDTIRFILLLRHVDHTADAVAGLEVRLCSC